MDSAHESFVALWVSPSWFAHTTGSRLPRAEANRGCRVLRAKWPAPHLMASGPANYQWGVQREHPATRTGCLRRRLRGWWLGHRDLSFGCVEKVHILLFRAGNLKADEREADLIDRIVR
jgi:hypothetical protein